MALTRTYDEHEIGPDLRRIYGAVRAAFDLPFVPPIIKVLAGHPAYLKRIWDDLGPVVSSREFQSAASALEELIHSQVAAGGWRFADQQKILSAEAFAPHDIAVVHDVVSTFSHALPRLALFARLLQRGYSQGQRGHITRGKSAAVLSQLISLHVPNEKDASLRVWLIYCDVRKTIGFRHVPGVLCVLSPYPGYLASVWTEIKRVFKEPSFIRTAEDAGRRASALLTGLPVRDHRASVRLQPEDWREIEEAVDGFARQAPPFALITAIWRRAFPQYTKIAGAA